MEFVGQTRLLNMISTLDWSSLPSALILVGDKGSGKKTLAKIMADMFNARFIELEPTLEFISDAYIDMHPSIYYIYSNKITEKEESVLLKFIEEPPVNSHVFILTESTQTLLKTILNRGIVWKMDPYSEEELDKFADTYPAVLNTPGKILEYNSFNVEKFMKLCYNILEHLKQTSFSSLFSLQFSLNFTDKESDKFPADLFIDILSECASFEFKKGSISVDAYKVINELKNGFYVNKIDKVKLFESSMYRLKEVA